MTKSPPTPGQHETDINDSPAAAGDPPTVLHLGHHPQPGGGFRDLTTRVGGRNERVGAEHNPVVLVDSPECAERARDCLESRVKQISSFGPGAVDRASLALLPVRLPSAVLKLVKIVSRTGVDVVHSNDFRSAFLGALVASVADVALVVHVHQTSAPSRYPPLRRFIFRVADRVVHVSEHTRRVFDAEQDEKHVVVRSPLDIDAWTSREGDPNALKRAHGIGDGPVVSLVGRLSERKGHERFIAAGPGIIDAHPDATLLVVGGGDASYRGRLEDLAREHDVDDAVVFTGFWEDIVDVYRLSDVVVIPSVAENLPKVVQEATAFKCPVVATNSGGIPELVVDGETGLLVPEYGTPEELTAAVARLLDDPSFACALAGAGHSLLREEFDVPRVCEDLERVYVSVT
jgi:glycosyltransferase involved in cell wall biosynthesis